MAEEKNPLDEYVRKIVIDTLKGYPVDNVLKYRDAEVIIQAIMPEVDRLISERVKFHLKEILSHISKEFNI